MSDIKYKKCGHGHFYPSDMDNCPHCAQFWALQPEVNKLAEQWASRLREKIPSFSAAEAEELHANFVQKSNYGYMAAKAARHALNEERSIDSRVDNFFGYPLIEYWNMPQVNEACREFLYDVKGLSAADYFTAPATAVRELFEMFHFTLNGFEKTASDDVIKMRFKHKVTFEDCFAYGACKDTSILARHPFFFRVDIAQRLQRRGVNTQGPVLVDMRETESFVKIYTAHRSIGIPAEYTYAELKYPGGERVLQWYGTKDIDGKPTAVDGLRLKLPGGTEKEIIFDISDFKNEFE